MVNLTPSVPSWKRRMFAFLCLSPWLHKDAQGWSFCCPSAFWVFGRFSCGASETQPWGDRQGSSHFLPPFGALVALSQHALLFPKSSLDMVKMETKWKRNCSEFSLDRAAGLSVSFRASFLSHRLFCFQGCASEASGHPTFWICFRLVPFSHHPWSCPCFHL